MLSKLKHPAWVGVVLPLTLAAGSTFSPEVIRMWLLLAAVGAATWTFCGTEFAGKRLAHTGVALVLFAGVACAVFFAGKALDARSKPVIKINEVTAPLPPVTQESPGSFATTESKEQTQKEATSKPKSVPLSKSDAEDRVASGQPTYGAQHNEAGSTGYQANGPNAKIEVHNGVEPETITITKTIRSGPEMVNGWHRWVYAYATTAQSPIPAFSVSFRDPSVTRVLLTANDVPFAQSCNPGNGQQCFSTEMRNARGPFVVTVFSTSETEPELSYACDRGVICR